MEPKNLEAQVKSNEGNLEGKVESKKEPKERKRDISEKASCYAAIGTSIAGMGAAGYISIMSGYKTIYEILHINTANDSPYSETIIYAVIVAMSAIAAFSFLSAFKGAIRHIKDQE